MTYTPNILKIKVKGGPAMQANLSLIRGDTLPLSIDSIAIQGTEEKYILSDTDIIYMDTQSF